MDSPEEIRPVPDRFSPVRVSSLLRLAESNARSFAVASAMGAILDENGTTNTLRSANGASGVLITKKRRKAVLGELAIGVRRWQRLVADWERRYIAHRCSSGVVVLFVQSLLAECPWVGCRQPLEQHELPPPARRQRGEGFADATYQDAESELLGRVTRTTSSHDRALAGRILSTNQEHHKTGLLRRDEEGLGEEVRSSGVPKVPKVPKVRESEKSAASVNDYDGVKALEYLVQDETRRKGGK